jgi:hypothetical protein
MAQAPVAAAPAAAKIDWQGIFDAALTALVSSLGTSLGKKITGNDISDNTKREIDTINRRLATLIYRYRQGAFSVTAYRERYISLEMSLQSVLTAEEILSEISQAVALQTAENAAFAALGAAAQKMPIPFV